MQGFCILLLLEVYVAQSVVDIQQAIDIVNALKNGQAFERIFEGTVEIVKVIQIGRASCRERV